jgi:hypothetical protein
MKELFKQLVSTTQKNEISVKNAFKMWAFIVANYWLFHFVLHLFLPMLVSFPHLINLLSVFINQLSLIVIFVLLGCNTNWMNKLLPSVQIQFVSAAHVFIFSYVVIQLILFSMAVGSEISYLLMHAVQFITPNKIGLIFDFINFSTAVATIFVYVSYFIFSLLGFFVFHKIVQYGWFTIRVQEKNN